MAVSSACSERSASLVSGTVSFGGQTPAMSSRDTASAHDYPSLTISDDISVDFTHDFESIASYGKVLVFLFCFDIFYIDMIFIM